MMLALPRRAHKTLLALIGIIFLLMLPAQALAFSPAAEQDHKLWQDPGAPYAWAKDDIDQAVEFEIFVGYIPGYKTVTLPDGTKDRRPELPFWLPGNTITRAEFAQALARVMAYDTPAVSQPTFKDTPADAWYTPAVEALVQHGVIDPAAYAGRKLQPNAPVTRYEIAAWVAAAGKAYGLAPDPAKAQAFPDVNSADNAAVQAAVSLGIINGYPDGTFRPQAFATRAEAAAMLMRLVRQLNDNPPALADLKAAVDADAALFGDFASTHPKAAYPASVYKQIAGVADTPFMAQRWAAPYTGSPADPSLGALFEWMRVEQPLVRDYRFAAVSVAPIMLLDARALVAVNYISHPEPLDGNNDLSDAYYTGVQVGLVRGPDGHWRYAYSGPWATLAASYPHMLQQYLDTGQMPLVETAGGDK